MKRKIIVDHMDDESKKVLAEFLKSHNIEMWENSEEQLRKDLTV